MYALIALYCTIYAYDTGLKKPVKNCHSQVIRQFNSESECKKNIDVEGEKIWSNDNRTVTVRSIRRPSACIAVDGEKVSEQTYDLVWRKK